MHPDDKAVLIVLGAIALTIVFGIAAIFQAMTGSLSLALGIGLLTPPALLVVIFVWMFVK